MKKIIITGIICMLTLAACFSPMGAEKDATFSITIGGGGRGVLYWDTLTDTSDLEHTIILTGGPGPDVMRKGVREGRPAQFKVATGHWHITVKAYLGDMQKAEGIGDVYLKPGPNKAVTITMGPLIFDITMQTDGNGTATAEPNPAIAGETVEIHAIPNNGYMFNGWQVISGGAELSSMTTSSASFTMPSAPVTIRAEFKTVPSNTPVLSMTTVEFNNVIYGYSQPPAQTVTVRNTGSAPTTEVRITVGGTGADSFTLGDISTQTIAADDSATFTVQPNVGLDVGTHTATITATYSGGVVKNKKETIDVSFTVDAVPINSVNIIITAPVNGFAPGTEAGGTGNFTVGTVSWSPSDNKFLGGVVYTASVTLTANKGHTFAGLGSATVNGAEAVKSGNNGSTVTLSHAFPRTDTRTIKFITIKTQPANMAYTHDDELDLTGLVVTLTYNDGTAEDVAAANFSAKNITADPSHGDNLIHSAHDKQPVKIKYGLECDTGKLTVRKADPTVTDFIISDVKTFTYDGSPKSVTITPKDGKSDGEITVKYNGGTDEPSGSGAYAVTFDVAEGANYNAKSGLSAGTLTINRAVVSLSAIHGVTVPAAGNNPVTAITQTPQYGGTVTWSPADPTFKSTKTYTATIKLTPDNNHTLQGVPENFFTVAGAATVSHHANSDTVTAVFPATHGEVRIDINLWVNEDGQILDLNNNNVTISKNGANSVPRSFTATVDSEYADVQWLMLGVPLGSGASITVNAADYNTGIYRINVIARKNGVSYSTEIRFTVTN